MLLDILMRCKSSSPAAAWLTSDFAIYGGDYKNGRISRQMNSPVKLDGGSKTSMNAINLPKSLTPASRAN
jgi:hypothetical protein